MEPTQHPQPSAQATTLPVSGNTSTKKILKGIAIVVAVLVLLVVALLAYVSFAFDPNQFKTQITQVVLEKKQRTLAIDGDIRLRFFPKLGVELGRVSLSEKNNQVHFAKLDSARVSLALLPLLSKKIVVDKISLRGLELHLQRNEDGKSNIDDLLGQDESNPKNDEQKNDARSSNSLLFDVEGIELSDANIQISDAKTQFVGALKNLQLTSGRLADKTATPIHFSSQVSAQQQGKTVTDALVTLDTGLRFDLSTHEFGLEKLALNLDGILQGNKLKLALKAPQWMMRPNDFALTIAGLEANLQTHVAQGDVVLNLHAPRIEIDQNKASSDKMTGDLSISGTQNLTARLSTGAISGNSKALKLDQLVLELERKQGAQTVKADFHSALEADLEQMIFSMAQFGLNLQIHDPALPQADIKLPISGKLVMNLKAKLIQTELQSKFDESQLKAQFDVRDFSAPQISFNATVDRINLDRYMKPSPVTAPAKEGAANHAGATAAESPIDLSALKGVQLDGKLNIGQLQIKNIKMMALQLPLKLHGGVLEMKGMRAHLYQGELLGDVSVRASDNHFTMQQTLSGIQIQPLLKDAINKDLVEGRGNLKLALQSQGKTTTQMKQMLNGDISVSLTDGAVKGINLAQSFRDFKSKILNKSDQDQAANVNEKTDFSAMSGSIHFVDGIGHSDDLNMKSPFLRIGGSGTVNLRDSTLDYVATVNVVESSTGQGGVDLSQLKGISIPVRVKGPFDHLAYKIQFGKIGADVLKSAVKEKAKPILEEKKKELLNKLKGLFQR
ncbi:MAG: AsmA family protein [Burkholderiaceae bacterium]|nr:AsmA family protein [Burkholderiaceae bacterium]